MKGTGTFLTKFVFDINPVMSVWPPTQCIEFLLYSVTLTVFFIKSKVERMHELCKSTLKKISITIRKCSQFIGTLIFILHAVPHKKLFTGY